MDKSQKKMGPLFDRVAPFYDFLNHVLSLCLDIRWRRRAIRDFEIRDREQILDIATGTGDLALEALRENETCRVIGLDLSMEMMSVAVRKRDGRDIGGRYHFARGDALRMPLKARRFDKSMVAFGVRNMPDAEGLFREVHRVLKTDGRFAVLEFSIPENPFVRSVYLFYFKKILPRVGDLVSRNAGAYRHLRDSVLGFYTPAEMEVLLRGAGFSVIRSMPLTFGICHFYLAEKGSGSSDGEANDRAVRTGAR